MWYHYHTKNETGWQLFHLFKSRCGTAGSSWDLLGGLVGQHPRADLDDDDDNSVDLDEEDDLDDLLSDEDIIEDPDCCNQSYGGEENLSKGGVDLDDL